MNPVIAAAAAKAAKEATSYASKVGQAVIDSKENQEEMERKLKLPKGSINRIAEGKDDPKLSTVIGIADMLGTSLDKLTGYVNKNAERARQEKHMRESLDDLDKTLSVIDKMDKGAETSEVVDYTRDSIAGIIKRSEKAKASERAAILRSGMKSLSANLTSIGKVRQDEKTTAVTSYASSYIDGVLAENEPEKSTVKDVVIMKPEVMSKMGIKSGDIQGEAQFIEATPEMMHLFDNPASQIAPGIVKQSVAQPFDVSDTEPSFVTSLEEYSKRKEAGRSRMARDQLSSASRRAESLALDKGLVTSGQNDNDIDFDR